MSAMTNLQQAIDREEGRSYVAYPDPLTKGDPWTCGAGCTGPDVKPGTVWNDATIDAKRDAHILAVTIAITKALPWFVRVDDARRGVLQMMAYQMGVGGLLKFPKMLTACRELDFAEAADQMRDSLWARQTPKRCQRMAWQMEHGEWIKPGVNGAPP